MRKESNELGIDSIKFPVANYIEKRHDDANYLYTGEENKGFAKERKTKMSPFYVEGDTTHSPGGPQDALLAYLQPKLVLLFLRLIP
jgi:hypothetical protein